MRWLASERGLGTFMNHADDLALLIFLLFDTDGTGMKQFITAHRSGVSRHFDEQQDTTATADMADKRITEGSICLLRCAVADFCIV